MVSEEQNLTIMSNSEADIRKIIPNAPWTSLYCPCCQPLVLPLLTDIQQHNSFSWAKQLRCNTCNTRWVVCTECASSRKPFTNRRQCLDHDRFYHREGADIALRHKKQRNALEGDQGLLQNTQLSFDDNFNSSALECEGHCLPTEVFDVDSATSYKLTCFDPTFDNFGNYNNKTFFEMEHYHGAGTASLVSIASFKDFSCAGKVSEEEVELHLNVTRLVCSLTRGQVDDLGVIFGQLSSVIKSKMRQKETVDLWSTKIPTSSRDVRSLYISGKHAIIPNLPRPSVSALKNHAYVSLHECIADLLGHGLDFDSITTDMVPITVKSISDSRQAKIIFEHAKTDHLRKLVLYLNEWSDAFEPSKSSKSNRGSCWIKSITVGGPTWTTNGTNYTYPIAVGSDGVSHDEVEARFAFELNQFKTGREVSFYHGSKKKNVIVYIELLASLQDQPERRKGNGIMLGGSKYTACWGYTVDIAQVWPVIPPCNECEASLFDGSCTSNTITSCTQCVCWDLGKNTTLLHYGPPNNYPEEDVLTSGKIAPMKLTYEMLKCAALRSHQEFVHGTWSKSNVESFLKVRGINTACISAILHCADNCRRLTEMESNPMRIHDAALQGRYEELVTDKQQNPMSYEPWTTPALWDRGVELSQHVDVVMHLLFLGIVRTTLEMVQEWSKRRGKNAAFIRYLEGTLESLQCLGLDWCRCMAYKSGKFGGWVSENFVGVSRLLTWLYSGIDSIAADVSFEEPTVPQRRWTKRQNVLWLSIRGLTTSGAAKEISDIVAHYLTQPQGPPPILPPPGGTVLTVTNTLKNLQAMIARVMADAVTDKSICDVDCHIKKFLTSFHKMDQAMLQQGNKPTWITSYNFICLTNIPQVMYQFGPVRNLWEGGNQGEKIIRVLKPLWFGFRKNWEVNLMTNALNIMAVDRVLHTEYNKRRQTDTNTCNKEVEKSIGLAKKMVHKYASREEVTERYLSRKPLSVVQLTDGRYGCIIRRTNFFVELNCSSRREQHGGSWYYQWTMNTTDTVVIPLRCTNIKHYCLLLPKLTMHGMPTSNNEPMYMAITSDWLEMNDEEDFSMPKST